MTISQICVDTLATNISRPLFRWPILGAVVVVAGCTTANQQSLGVGFEPATTAPAVSTGPDTAGDAQNALAPVDGGQSPSVAAVTSIAEPATAAPVIANVGFLPITGAPKEVVASLSKALGASSKLHNIGIAGAGDMASTYQLKGYMSALNEGSRTTVTFYWDVLDRTGKRLYRINGFEQESGAKRDPWQGVSERTMQRIASRTMGSFANWIKRKGA